MSRKKNNRRVQASKRERTNGKVMRDYRELESPAKQSVREKTGEDG